MNKLIDFLIKEASQESVNDIEDYNPYAASGGNYDDAFENGIVEGNIQLAREILDKFFPDEGY